MRKKTRKRIERLEERLEEQIEWLVEVDDRQAAKIKNLEDEVQRLTDNLWLTCSHEVVTYDSYYHAEPVEDGIKPTVYLFKCKACGAEFDVAEAELDDQPRFGKILEACGVIEPKKGRKA